MTEKTKMKMLVLFAITVLLIAIPLIYLTMSDPPEDTEESLVTVMGTSMSLDELKEMDIVSGTVRFQNRFGNWNEPTEYTGVTLSSLVEDMESTDILVVTATDGYSQRFSYRQIFPSETNSDIQGDIILAYKEGDSSVPDWEDGPMIAVLPEDGEFSNADLNMTKSLVSDFNRQSSAGSLWVRNVNKIELITGAYSDTEIALTLEGITTHHYTLEEIMNMNYYTEEGSRIRSTGRVRGPNTYRGVNMTKLDSNVYSDTEYTLEVEAEDGYTMTYSRGQVEGDIPVYDEDFNELDVDADITMMLAYEQDGENVPEWVDGPRIAFVSEEAHITDGHLWNKMVRYIRVKPLQEDWSVEVIGLETRNIDKQYFESAANCPYHRAEYQDGEDTYAGMTLWELIAAVDGGDPPDGHYMYNTVLADLGYNVVVEAGDGFSTTFTSEQVSRNDTIIVANELNGEPLPESDAPLRLVGEHLSGSQSVRNIVRIDLTDIPDNLPDWSLTLNGTIVRDYDAMVFGSLVGCGVHTEGYTVDGDTYEGIPLWILIAAVDDGETLSHWSLNETLVERGYEVEVIAEDGYSYTFDIADVAFNDTMILASRFNGEPLEENEAPLRLVGEGLSGEQSVRNVVEIRLIGLEL